MKKNLIILIAALGSAAGENIAQVSSYSFNQFAGAYGVSSAGDAIGSNNSGR